MSEPAPPLRPPRSFLESVESRSIVFDVDDVERLGCYLALLRRANAQMNLTAVTEPEAMWMRHILDSLTLLPYIDAAGATSLCDVGSGAGPPGLVLAIVLSDVHVTLIEATGKKARFLEETAVALGLSNVRVVNERAETAGRDREQHRERYEIVTARAVGPLPTLLELTVPLATVGGRVLAIKGERAQTEIDASREALYRLHCHVERADRTPTGTIVVIEKKRRTPKLYPRRPGEPKRAPIGGTTVSDASKEGRDRSS